VVHWPTLNPPSLSGERNAVGRLASEAVTIPFLRLRLASSIGSCSVLFVTGGSPNR
jgi:hypothetical protein